MSDECGTAALGCVPPEAEVMAHQQENFDLRSNTAEGGCATSGKRHCTVLRSPLCRSSGKASTNSVTYERLTFPNTIDSVRKMIVRSIQNVRFSTYSMSYLIHS